MNLDRETISYLRILHGLYNTTVMVMFFYQGCLGLKIRKDRKRNNLLTLHIVKRHRRFGPFLALFGVAGFFAGLTLVYIDYGDIMKYPIHLLVGLAIVSLVSITFIISRKIKGLDSPWRTPHFRIGIVILVLYCIQIFLGLGILL